MKISFTETIKISIDTVNKNIKFYTALVMLFLLGNLALLGALLMMEEPSLLLIILVKLLELALYVKLAVTVHRSVLLNEVWQWQRIFSWHKHESLFFSMIFAIGIAAGLAMIFFMYIISLVFGDGIDGYELIWIISIILIGGAIFAKICLIFPSTAIDNEMAIEESINVTKDAFINIFLLIVMIPIAFNVIAAFVLTENLVWLNIISAFIFNLVLVFEITILSHIYQQLTQDEANNPKSEIHQPMA